MITLTIWQLVALGLAAAVCGSLGTVGILLFVSGQSTSEVIADDMRRKEPLSWG